MALGPVVVVFRLALLLLPSLLIAAVHWLKETIEMSLVMLIIFLSLRICCLCRKRFSSFISIFYSIKAIKHVYGN